MVSDCCGARLLQGLETALCSECLEHCNVSAFENRDDRETFLNNNTEGESVMDKLIKIMEDIITLIIGEPVKKKRKRGRPRKKRGTRK
mgnify:FL=1|jgi:hypothetical protein|tara:strand:+ start:5453 stop:5716 length:264 start_codon:yes stop_codon:yes gene_type:complete